MGAAKRLPAWISLILVHFLLIATAWGSDYPIKPIQLYVGYSAGGGTDTAARIVTNQVNKFLEQPILVVNKTGGATAVAADFVAKSKPDGYTLFNATLTTVIQPIINSNNPFKLDDFEAIARLYSMPMVIVTKGDSKLKTIEELIDFCRKNPGRLSIGTPGINGINHFALELFKKEAKIEVNHIPFQGDPPLIVGVLGGHVDAALLGFVAVAEHLKTGTMRGLVTSFPQRLPSFPNLPAMAEKGFGNAALSTWGGVFAPAGVPKAVIDKLSMAYQKAAPEPEVVTQLQKVGFTANYLGAQEFTLFLKNEQKKFTDIAQSAGMIKK